ncbi:MAG: aldo/keto reductase [Actinobacteria bacterium]|nr:aldo/keto reductase [Actinomycetota bacterium]
MRTRALGTGGPEVSVVGLGCNNFGWRIGPDESRAVVDAAIGQGITLLDTADVYGETRSESFLGEALAGRLDRVCLLTKFGNPVPDAPDLPKGSPDYVRWAVDGSLRRLRTDAIDVYMYHRPDGVTPIAETIGAMAGLVHDGKVRYVGVSHVDLAQLEEAAATAAAEGIPLVGCENRYSLITRGADADIVPACLRLGVGLIPFYPLESGALTGKYTRGAALPADSRFAAGMSFWDAEKWLTDDVFDKIEALERFAAAHGASLLDVAIGGLAAMPAVGSVIAGATTAEQVVANAKAGEWVPTASELEELQALTA